MVKLTINGQPYDVERDISVLEACQQAGIEIPVFCYHPKLSVAGNCRMCLVEMEKSKKPIASCAMPVSEGMVIKTDSEKVKRARQGVLELLLINHPLDCPICDEGGECDLQDITMSYGRGRSRFDLNKRAVPEKFMGPLVKTVMTRCIHCTRCIRFSDEISGTSELGMFYRGEHAEVATFLESTLKSELSGNLVDICPVGALTNKPYAFVARPWELTKTPSIDVMDAVGSHIRIDSRNFDTGHHILRILPRHFESINEVWISDKTRHGFDGITSQRLLHPYVRGDEGRLEENSWQNTLRIAAEKLLNVSPQQVAAIAGDLVDVESMFALKKLMILLGSPHLECRRNGSTFRPRLRQDYLFNTTIAGIEGADACLLIATNPRFEASLINTRLRKRMLRGHFPIGMIGPQVDLTYSYEHLGETPQSLAILDDPGNPFMQTFLKAEHPMLIIGEAVLNHPESEKILTFLKYFSIKHKLIQEDWNGYNILWCHAASVGALDIDFLPQSGGLDLEGIYKACEAGDINVVYCLGADDLDFDRLKNATLIFQGHHGDAAAHHAQIIFPGAVYTEKNATYVNTEGRIQQTEKVLCPPGEAKEDWRIIRALSSECRAVLPFDNIQELREALEDEYPSFTTDGIETHRYPTDDVKEERQPFSPIPFALPVKDFYMTNVIARHSKLMAECSALSRNGLKEGGIL